MPYSLVYSGRAKVELLALDGLTREGRNRLFAHLDRLRNISDASRSHPDNRDGEDLIFLVAFRDAGRRRQFRFVVDDDHAVAGVLRILTITDASP